MGKFISTLLLGLIAAIIGATLQQRTWRHRSLVDLKEKEYDEAREVVSVLSVCLDTRLAAQRTYTDLVLGDEITQSDIDDYKTATTAWMGAFSSNKSKIYHSFGRDAVLEFENTVQRSLQTASAIVGLGRRLGPENLCTRDRMLFLNSVQKLNVIQHDVYKFLNELNQKISNGEIGRTKGINNLNANDESMISRVYLVRRLLGMEGYIRTAYW